MSETEYYSGFSKLCRITAYVIRLVNNITARSSKPVSPVGSGSLNSEEVLFRESLWILESQKSLLLNRNCKQQRAQLGVIGHEWNLEMQRKTLQLVSTGIS